VESIKITKIQSPLSLLCLGDYSEFNDGRSQKTVGSIDIKRRWGVLI
jgi:hypothetical protein